MHIIQVEIGLPKIKHDKKDENIGVFTIDPLPSGYGMTLGNSLRRVLLSSLPGAAIIAVRIEGAVHEYSTLDGVKDSVLDIILNLKQVNIKKNSPGQEIVKLKASGEGDVTAKQIEASSDIEILNPDYVITTLDSKNSSLEMEIVVDKGVGYMTTQENTNHDLGVDFILIDALFSPVRKVRYDVQSTRVGQRTNLDKLTLEIETNGSMAPEDTLKFSAELLRSYFDLFNKEEEVVEPDFMTSFSALANQPREEEEVKKESYTPIEILNLSPRTLNALINGGVGSIEQLVKCNPIKLSNFRGFGKKAMDEVSAALATRGLILAEE